MATVVAFAAAGTVNCVALKGKAQPAYLLPVQSRDVKSLGVGKLLVASRGLGDPSFAETVILLVHYDAEGVVGLVLNRRTNFPLSRVLGDFKAAKNRSDAAYRGGPVNTTTVLALYQPSAKIEGADHVFDNVYLISSKPVFEQILPAQPDPDVFLFIWAMPDGTGINCKEKWSWACGSFFPRIPKWFLVLIRIPCGDK